MRLDSIHCAKFSEHKTKLKLYTILPKHRTNSATHPPPLKHFSGDKRALQLINFMFRDKNSLFMTHSIKIDKNEGNNHSYSTKQCKETHTTCN